MKSRSVRHTVLVITVLGVMLLIRYQYLEAKRMAIQLQLGAESFGHSQQHHLHHLWNELTLKPGLASLEVGYSTDMDFADVKATSAPILENSGWQIIGERHIQHWGPLTDVDELRLHKGSVCAGLYYSGGSQKQVLFISTWVISGCSDQ